MYKNCLHTDSYVCVSTCIYVNINALTMGKTGKLDFFSLPWLLSSRKVILIGKTAFSPQNN